MRIRLCSFMFTSLLLMTAPSHALESFVLYDDFTAAVINPLKWYGSEFFGRGTEALRLVQTGRLRMLYRAYGNKGLNTGQRVSALDLQLLRKTSLITAIKATVRVSSFASVNCAANNLTSNARAGIQGAFFNADFPQPGSNADDVRAGIGVSSSAAEPGVLHVRSFVYRCIDNSCFVNTPIDGDDLGTVSVNTDVTLQLQWDPAFNRFLFRRDALPFVISTYTDQDVEKPGVAFKTLEVASSPENCATAVPPQAFMDATFDNVQVNQSAQ